MKNTLSLSRTGVLHGVFCCFCVGLLAAEAQDFHLQRGTIAGGGGSMIGGDFQLQGTIGQPVGGTLSGGDFFLTQGMWFPISAGDCEEDGDIDLFDFQQFETCLTGPASLGTVGCACVDMDRNGQIDLLDFARMQVELVVP